MGVGEAVVGVCGGGAGGGGGGQIEMTDVFIGRRGRRRMGLGQAAVGVRGGGGGGGGRGENEMTYLIYLIPRSPLQ